MGAQLPEFKLDGCTVAYNEGGIISLTSDRDPEDRLLWTPTDADAVARIFRHLAPGLSAAARELASLARLKKIGDRHARDE